MGPSRITDGIRVIFISWEMAFICGALALWLVYPEGAQILGGKVVKSDVALAALPGIPVAVLVWAISQANQIFAPASAAQNAHFRAWGEYWRVKLRVFIALIWIAISCGFGLSAFLFGKDISSALLGALAIVTVLIPVSSAASLWLAATVVRETVEK